MKHIYCWPCLLLALHVSGDSPLVEIRSEDWSGPQGALINGTLYQTVKSYYCRTDSPSIYQELLVYGARAWSFPQQDVNLTLLYPPQKSNKHPKLNYLITELKVILYMEGAHSQGYITRGGLMQNNVSMTFILRSSTRLSYHFWLYGVPRTAPVGADSYNNTEDRLC